LRDFDRNEKALRLINKQLLALEDIVVETKESEDANLAYERLRRWKELTVRLLAESVSKDESMALRTREPAVLVMGQPLRNLLAEAADYEAFLLALNEALQKHPEIIPGQDQPKAVLRDRPAVATDLFISYSSKDTKFVARLAQDLHGRGVEVWWDKWMMKVGDSLHRKIQDGIKNSALLGVVLSPHSVSSPWVEKELNSALMKELEQKEVVVLPILYRDCDVPLFLRDKLYADFRSSYEEGLRALLERVTPRIRSDLLDGLLSGSSSTITISYAQTPAEHRKSYVNELAKKLDSSSVRDRSAALTALFTIRDAALPTHLIRMAADSSDTVRRLAVFYLGELRAKYAVKVLSERLSDKSSEVRAEARIAFRKVTGAKS
jgi:hypothetical protein